MDERRQTPNLGVLLMWWLILLVVPIGLAPTIYIVWRDSGELDDDPDDLLRSGYGW